MSPPRKPGPGPCKLPLDRLDAHDPGQDKDNTPPPPYTAVSDLERGEGAEPPRPTGLFNANFYEPIPVHLGDGNGSCAENICTTFTRLVLFVVQFLGHILMTVINTVLVPLVRTGTSLPQHAERLVRGSARLTRRSARHLERLARELVVALLRYAEGCLDSRFLRLVGIAVLCAIAACMLAVVAAVVIAICVAIACLLDHDLLFELLEVWRGKPASA